MIKVKIKMLSLQYHADEDRMKLVINKDTDDRIEFWITRRFYLSLLFELETFLEQLNISPSKFVKNKEKSQMVQSKNSLNKKLNTESLLLKNINIKFIKERKSFIFLFQSNMNEAESIFKMEQFLNFYTSLKSSFPTKEWGMI